ncbi:2-octaprenyl-6-methoxyphenyl hydroxylase [Coxiella endosymbiont of Dermacentor marginatus]|uniref:2-octaprenyl-6-methoxyphenyl hydroxylase n=1 Tax=Coxiella endosymbiont of Dermacentor marginatus TaxID=1656159 RepID=UPI002222E7D7|nr:2-octaprenyl-6-methoxyphenyl hydroxylase [Coxiella endosymbiont of Dermacentor marginatus]
MPVLQNKLDLIIIGAGLIGTSLAVSISMQNHGLRIKILEHNLPNINLPLQKDMRPIALSYASYQILRALGIWESLDPESCPIFTVHVSDQGALGTLCFRSSELGISALGYVVPFYKLQETLYQKAASQNNVEIIPITEILAIHCNNDMSSVNYMTVEGEKDIQASLLVAADGTQSTARRLLNIPIEEKNENEVALVASMELTKPHNQVAYERFTPQGTLAILPLFAQNQCRLVWSLSKQLADKVSQYSDTEFQDKIQKIFKNRLGDIKSLKRSKQFPLQLLVAKEQIRPSFVLLGNAAHTLYPIAAQGFNLGLRDAAALSELIVSTYQWHDPLIKIDILQEYIKWRKEDQDRIIRVTRNISQWFDLRLPLVNRVRGLGLLITELLPPIKNQLAKRLLGLSGRLPKSMRYT